MLQWFIRFPEFAEILLHLEKTIEFEIFGDMHMINQDFS